MPNSKHKTAGMIMFISDKIDFSDYDYRQRGTSTSTDIKVSNINSLGSCNNSKYICI